MTKTSAEANPILDYLKNMQREGDDKGVFTLSTGYKARIVPIGATIIDELTMQITPPKVPTFFNEDKQREEENPNDPEYLAALEAHTKRQSLAAMEIMIMLGVELVDPVPEDDHWLRKLQFLAKRGILDLSGYDFDDPLDRELAFKKYIVVGTADLFIVGRFAGLSQDDIMEASQFFKS